MDVTEVAHVTGIAVPILTLVLEMYRAFKRSNVETFFAGLVKAGVDLKALGNQEELLRYFVSVVDRVANEANARKIDCWKNAIVHLATDFRGFQFRDAFISALDQLTVFDLTVLHKVYSTDFSQPAFEGELIDFFVARGVPRDYVVQSLKRLASHNLVTEQYDHSFVLGAGFESFRYTKNALGPEFLRFVSEYDGAAHSDNQEPVPHESGHEIR